ncbi:transposase [Chryseolinea lacunae]|uniref:Transposase n=1 Tax=Chryseolinea lacunae TaxID=2801331 RepID=A0ABS1KRN3_9BACT|nr:transposase [Chryseolinea lacunae]MBL0742104.1 transposase [Chryseolinea lacunae]
MKETTITTTRKIQILIDSPDKDFIKDAYKTLSRWQSICQRSANYLFTHQFIQHQLKDMVYLREDIQLKLADWTTDPQGMLTTSRQNSTYRFLSSQFKGLIPMHILNALNHTLVVTYSQKAGAYQRGEESISNYKHDIPIPFLAENVRRLTYIKERNEYSFQLFSIPFRTYLGHDQVDKRRLMQQWLEGTVKFCGSSLQLAKRKLYLLATFEQKKEQLVLSDEIIAEASLSLDYPVVLTIGKAVFKVGSKEEFLYRRMAIQAARQRALSAATFCRGGKGKKRKFQGAAKFKDIEKAFVRTKLHTYSKKVIDLCLAHKAATLILVNQQEKEEQAKNNAFVFRNWGYGGLKEKLAYKAARAGITIITE